MPTNYLKFWGVRGSYPAPYPSHMGVGGNTPCVELRLGDEVIVFDAGTGIIPLGKALMEQENVRAASVILSHYHWDHISGLPFFDPAFDEDWTIRFYGPAEKPAELEAHLAQQMKVPYFPVATETWLARISYHTPHTEPFTVGPVSIAPVALHHPGITYGYRLAYAGKTLVYAPDNELGLLHRAVERSMPSFGEQERHWFDQVRAEEREQLLDLMRDADLLIHDAQYTPEDYVLKQRWGHSCYIETVEHAIDAGVKDLFFFSHDPSYDDAKLEELRASGQGIADKRQSDLACWLAKEGSVVDLDEYARTGTIAQERVQSQLTPREKRLKSGRPRM